MQPDVDSLLRGSRFAHHERGLRPRSRAFALRIVHVYESLPRHGTGSTLGKQLLRCGTSVGAQVAEASRAKSRADFVSKLEGAMQELEVTVYWLALLIDSSLVKQERLQLLLQESSELMGILVTMVKKTRQSQDSAA